MGNFIEILFKVIGNFFNDTELPWYVNVGAGVLVFLGTLCIIFVILQLLKKLKKEKGEA